MIRPSTLLRARALAFALLVVAGCSVTLKPIRLREPADTRTSPSTASTATQPVHPDAPIPTCPDPAPPPPSETGRASFVLQNGHERPITTVALSSNGRTLVSGGFDGTVRIWDLGAGLLLRKFVTAGAFVQGMSLSDDGKRLAYYAPDGTPESSAIQVIDVDDRDAKKRSFQRHGSFTLSPDGKQLAQCADKLVVYDTETRRASLEIPISTSQPSALALAYDAEGHRVATAYPNEIVIVDLAKGAVTERLAIQATQPTDVPLQVAFDRDIVVMRASTGTVTLFPLGTGGARRVLPGRFKGIAVADGKVWATDLMTSVVSGFTLPDARAIPLTTNHLTRAAMLVASRDGSTLVAVEGNEGFGTRVDVRDVRTMRTVRTIEGRAMSISAISVSPDGREVAVGHALGDLHRWDLGAGIPRPGVTEHGLERSPIAALAFSPSGAHLVSTTGLKMLRVRDASNGRTLRQWSVEGGAFIRFMQFLPKTDELLTFRVTTERKLLTKAGPNGKPVIQENHDAALERWDLRGPKPPPPPKPFGEFGRPDGKVIAKLATNPSFFALSKDGARLVVGGRDMLVSLRTDTGSIAWKTKLDAQQRSGKTQPDGGLELDGARATFSPDGATLLISTKRQETNASGQQRPVPALLELDAATGRVRRIHHPGTNGPVQWHEDAIVIGGFRTALLDAKTFAVRARLELPDNQSAAIELHPARDLFLIGGDGGATSVVDMNGKVIATLVSTPNGEWVSATPEGAYRSSIDGARSIAWTFADPMEGFSFERFASRFERPDLVAKRLGGQEAPAPASLARPPRLRLPGPSLRDTVTTPNEAFTVEATATSASRVDRVRAFVDGKPAVDRLVCASEGRVSLDVPLHAGRNRVTLVAYDAAGYASNPEQIDVVSTSPRAEKPSLHVVSVGVSRYPNMNPEQQLEYADDDARAVTASFTRLAGPNQPFERIRATTLLNDEVTVERVDDALKALADMRPDDLAIVFFAGHGARIDESRMLFLTSRAVFERGAALAHGIGWDRIERSLRGARGRVLVMLDACHAGYVSTEVVAPNEALARDLAHGDRTGILVFSAARGSQFSYEVPVDAGSGSSRGLELAWEGKPPPKQKDLMGGHGLFTSALLEALEGEAPDRDRSGAIEVNELVDYVTERVRAASNYKQTPWVARRELFGEFMVAPAAR